MLINVCKVLGMDVKNAPQSGFADMDKAADWAVDGINFCYASGIMQGTGNNNFSPRATYSRQQSTSV